MLDKAVPLFPGLPGGPEVLIVLFVLVLLFGANKIPKLARSTGEAMGEFKKGRQEIEEELQEMEGGGSETVSDEPSGRVATSTDTEPPAESTTTGTSADADATPKEETERETN